MLLSSLRDLSSVPKRIPSHKWLGYFQQSEPVPAVEIPFRPRGSFRIFGAHDDGEAFAHLRGRTSRTRGQRDLARVGAAEFYEPDRAHACRTGTARHGGGARLLR